MKHRVMFGKPLPRAFFARPAPTLGWMAGAAALVALAWFVAMLANRKSRASEEMVYVWPD